MFEIQTDRVGLRKFNDDDLDDYAALNADPDVMKFFPDLVSREKCNEFMVRVNQSIESQRFGFWAAEHLQTRQLMGFVGLNQVGYETEFTSAVEIGWRLAKKFWGQGLATEAATACLHFGFNRLQLKEIVSFTACLNTRSSRVMQRIGMKKIGEFNHPKLAPGHRLERHDLYKITRSQFEEKYRDKS